MPAHHNTPDTTAPVLITGAGRNIGAYMAWRFIEAGQPVIAHYRSPTEDIEALTTAGAQVVQANFDDAAAIQAMAAAVQAATPALRAIVHNASAFDLTAPDSATAARQMQQFFSVHMLAPFLLNQALADCLSGSVEQPADIIHITDIYADNPAPEYDAYCATKAGAQNLALAAAKRLAPTVKVNVIQPGPISFKAWHDSARQERVLQSTPLAQAGGPGAIYTAVRAIMANPFQTGAVIAVDGGRRLGRH